MKSIEKILKHNFFFIFTSTRNSSMSDLSIFYSQHTITYFSNTVYDPASLNITNSIDLMEKLKPFLYYLSSEYLERKNDNYFAGHVDVFFPDELVSTRVFYFRSFCCLVRVVC